jgi:hypothetical protein
MKTRCGRGGRGQLKPEADKVAGKTEPFEKLPKQTNIEPTPP